MISRKLQQRFLAALDHLQVREESIDVGYSMVVLAQFGWNQCG